MNNYLIVGIIALVVSVISSIISIFVDFFVFMSIGLYALAVYGIFVGLLDKKVRDE